MMLQRSQQIHHKEEMKRLDIQKEKEDRRWQEEKDLRLQRAKMEENRYLSREELRQQREKME